MSSRISLRGIACLRGMQPLFSELALEVVRGEAVAISGRTGSGKSTLLEIAAYLRRCSGTVAWEGKRLDILTKKELSKERTRAGFLFQNNALIHNYTVFDNLKLPLTFHGVLNEKEITERVCGYLERYGLMNKSRFMPDSLSAGQLRCVAIARAMIMEPDLLFLDEPLGNLDPATASMVIGALAEYREKKPETSMLIVSHSPLLLTKLSCRILITYDQRLVPIDQCNISCGAPDLELISYLGKKHENRKL